jgi:predicted DNA binding CopG/RHH family protein
VSGAQARAPHEADDEDDEREEEKDLRDLEDEEFQRRAEVRPGREAEETG